jgi:hypothetical protein
MTSTSPDVEEESMDENRRRSCLACRVIGTSAFLSLAVYTLHTQHAIARERTGLASPSLSWWRQTLRSPPASSHAPPTHASQSDPLNSSQAPSTHRLANPIHPQSIRQLVQRELRFAWTHGPKWMTFLAGTFASVAFYRATMP